MSPEPGATLGRYRIVRRLGAGAMGEVFLAQDPHIERQLAIKTVRLGDSGPLEVADRRVRLMREAKAAGRLVHPHVVTLFDAGEADGVFFLAFEYVAGPDLAGRVRLPPPLTLGEVLRIGRQAAEGLDAAHRQGIVHRDIKPSNILLAAGGDVKISDFGIAKMLGQATELTQTGSVVGSPHYLSPEQIRGEELDGRSDLFSLGVVLYELLTRHRPFEGDTLTTLVYQILAREPQPIAGMRPGLPPRVEATVVRLLAKDRDQRFPNARELVDELAGCERELSAAILDTPAASMPAELEETQSLGTPPPLRPAAGAEPATAIAPARLPPPADATGPTQLWRPPPPPPAGVPAGPALAAAAGLTAPSLAPPEGAHAAVLATGTAAPAPRRGFPWVLVVTLLLVGLLGVAALVGWFWYRHGLTQAAVDPTVAVAPALPAGVPAKAPPGPPTVAPGPPPTPTATAAPTAAAATALEAPPGTASSAAVEPTPPPAVAATASAPAPARRTEIARAPREVTPRPARAAAAPASPPPPPPRQAAAEETVTAPPARPRPAEAVVPPAARPEPPAREAPAAAEPFDQQLNSTLALKFKVEPPDAIVSFKEEGDGRFTVIGRAADFNADKKKLPAFDLPGPGTYYVRIIAEGRRVVYRVVAQPGPQPTIIRSVLIPKE